MDEPSPFENHPSNTELENSKSKNRNSLRIEPLIIDEEENPPSYDSNHPSIIEWFLGDESFQTAPKTPIATLDKEETEAFLHTPEDKVANFLNYVSESQLGQQQLGWSSRVPSKSRSPLTEATPLGALKRPSKEDEETKNKPVQGDRGKKQVETMLKFAPKSPALRRAAATPPPAEKKNKLNLFDRFKSTPKTSRRAQTIAELQDSDDEEEGLAQKGGTAPIMIPRLKASQENLSSSPKSPLLRRKNSNPTATASPPPLRRKNSHNSPPIFKSSPPSSSQKHSPPSSSPRNSPPSSSQKHSPSLSRKSPSSSQRNSPPSLSQNSPSSSQNESPLLSRNKSPLLSRNKSPLLNRKNSQSHNSPPLMRHNSNSAVNSTFLKRNSSPNTTSTQSPPQLASYRNTPPASPLGSTRNSPQPPRRSQSLLPLSTTHSEKDLDVLDEQGRPFFPFSNPSEMHASEPPQSHIPVQMKEHPFAQQLPTQENFSLKTPTSQSLPTSSHPTLSKESGVSFSQEQNRRTMVSFDEEAKETPHTKLITRPRGTSVSIEQFNTIKRDSHGSIIPENDVVLSPVRIRKQSRAESILIKPNFKPIELDLFLKHEDYLPGDVINGKVIILLTNSITNSVNVLLQGFEKSFEGIANDSSILHVKRKKGQFSSKLYFKDLIRLWEPSSDEPELASGEHEWDFSFTLPVNLPPTISFEDQVSTFYQIRAYTAPQGEDDSQATATQAVRFRIFGVNDIFYSRVVRKFTKRIGASIIAKKKSVAVFANIPRKDYSIGESLDLRVLIENNSKNSVAANLFTISLVQSIKIHTKSYQFKFDNRDIVSQKYTFDSFEVLSKTSADRDFKISLPDSDPHLLPTITATLFTISHFIQVTVNIPGISKSPLQIPIRLWDIVWEEETKEKDLKRKSKQLSRSPSVVLKPSDWRWLLTQNWHKYYVETGIVVNIQNIFKKLEVTQACSTKENATLLPQEKTQPTPIHVLQVLQFLAEHLPNDLLKSPSQKALESPTTASSPANPNNNEMLSVPIHKSKSTANGNFIAFQRSQGSEEQLEKRTKPPLQESETTPINIFEELIDLPMVNLNSNPRALRQFSNFLKTRLGESSLISRAIKAINPELLKPAFVELALLLAPDYEIMDIPVKWCPKIRILDHCLIVEHTNHHEITIVHPLDDDDLTSSKESIIFESDAEVPEQPSKGVAPTSPAPDVASSVESNQLFQSRETSSPQHSFIRTKKANINIDRDNAPTYEITTSIRLILDVQNPTIKDYAFTQTGFIFLKKVPQRESDRIGNALANAFVRLADQESSKHEAPRYKFTNETDVLGSSEPSEWQDITPDIKTKGQGRMKVEKIVSKFFDLENSQKLRDYDIYQKQACDVSLLNLDNYKDPHVHLQSITDQPPSLLEKIQATLSKSMDELLVVTLLPNITNSIALEYQNQIRIIKSTNVGKNIQKLLQSLAIQLSDNSGLIPALIQDFEPNLGKEPLYLNQFLNRNATESESPTQRLIKALNLELLCTAYQTLKLAFHQKFPIADIGAAWKVHIHFKQDSWINFTHLKAAKSKSENPEDSFELQWELRIVFNPDASYIKSASLKVTDIQISSNFASVKAKELQQLIQDFNELSHGFSQSPITGRMTPKKKLPAQIRGNRMSFRSSVTTPALAKSCNLSLKCIEAIGPSLDKKKKRTSSLFGSLGKKASEYNTELFFDTYLSVQVSEKEQKTRTIVNSPRPYWAEDMNFSITNPTTEFIRVTLMNAKTKTAVGKVEIPIFQFIDEKPQEQWFKLLPILKTRHRTISSNERDSSQVAADNGSVKLRIGYRENILFPKPLYNPILELLLEPPFELVQWFQSVQIDEKTQFCTTIVKIFTHNHKINSLLKTLSENEIRKQGLSNSESLKSQLLFNQTSLSTKMVEIYLRFIGDTYLENTLLVPIKKVFKYKKSLEIDPAKSETGTPPESRTEKLIEFIQIFLDSIFFSINLLPYSTPPDLKDIFSHLQSVFKETFPKDYEEEKVMVITGFLFLRFICPAIMNPKAYRLIPDEPTLLQSQNLIIIARIVQRCAQQIPYEANDALSKVNPVILRNTGNMTRFTEAVSSVPLTKPPEISPKMTIEDELSSLHRTLNFYFPQFKAQHPDAELTSQLFTAIESLNCLSNYQLSTQYPKLE